MTAARPLASARVRKAILWSRIRAAQRAKAVAEDVAEARARAQRRIWAIAYRKAGMASRRIEP